MRQSATFLAFDPSGRNTVSHDSHRCARRPFSRFQGSQEESVPVSRLHLSSVSGRLCSLCKEA